MLSCVRVSSVPGLLFDEVKLTESADLDLLTIYKCLFYYLQDRFYHVCGSVLRETKLLSDRIDYICFCKSHGGDTSFHDKRGTLIMSLETKYFYDLILSR